MKILTIVHNTVCSGASKSLLNLIKGLRHLKVEVEVIVPDEGNLCIELDKERVIYHKVPFYVSAYPRVNSFIDIIKYCPRLIKYILSNLLAVLKINSIVHKYKPDIIHSNVSVINVGYLVAKLNRIRHVWHIREYGDIDFDIKPFPSKMIKQKRLCKKSYTISITKDVEEYFNLRNTNQVIYNGIVDDEYKPFNLNKEDVFIYVGWITDNKGVPLIINAFKEFHKQHPDYKLYLIGEGDSDYILNLQANIKENNLSESILFLGYQSNVESYMQTAKALIVASKREGFGRITAEAMDNGCLVIGMNTGGTKEQFDNGKSLINREIGVRFNSEIELLENMHFVVDMDQTTYNQMIKDAQYVVHSLYSKQTNIDKTYKYFSEILNLK